MTISWMSVLQNAPWDSVVNNAPKVAIGASKLWKSVVQKPSSNYLPEKFNSRPNIISLETQGIVALKTRILELESATINFRDQMIDSSALIRALAEQNIQLVVRIECMRLYFLWLTGLLGIVGIVAAACLVMGLAK